MIESFKFKVLKRDGTIREFDMNKPVAALCKPFTEGLKMEVPEGIVDKFKEELEVFMAKQSNDVPLNIEIIQDFIRDFLIKENKSEAAENFILYREKRSIYREKQTKLHKNIVNKLYAKKIENQNANMDEASFGGRLGMAASEVSKSEALKMVPKKFRKNHENNLVYIHDLDHYVLGDHNCLTFPVDKASDEGFETRQTDVRGANSIGTALQLLAVEFQCQSLEQFGGVAAGHLDWSMVPYIRKTFVKKFKDGLKFKFGWDDLKADTYILKLIELNGNQVTIAKDMWKHPGWNPIIRHKVNSVYKFALEQTNKETHQGVEGLFHNLNTLQSRSGAQLPFSSINYGTCTLPEGQMMINAILDVTIEGLGKHHRTSIFPCGIFQYKKGINDSPGTPNYPLFRKALKATAKRIYPNYANCEWSVQKKAKEYDLHCRYEVLNDFDPDDVEMLVNAIKNDPKYAADRFRLRYNEDEGIRVIEEELPCELMGTMGCRTYNGADIWFKHSFEKNLKNWIHGLPLYDDIISAIQKDGRGNICPVTVIMPTIAMESIEYAKKSNPEPTEREKWNSFYTYLDKKIEEAKDMLIERFNYIASQNEASAKFMYTNRTMAGYVPEEGIISALRHGTLALGQLGLAETLQILFGCDHTTEKGMKYAKEIEKLFNERCAHFKEKYKLNIGVYYTPAENLCFTAMKRFKDKYGIIPNVSDKEYFTNSIHVPVYEEVNAFDKIDIESQLTGYSNAGCITYVEFPSTAINNIDAIEKIVNYAMDHDVPYFALNFPIDFCRSCHYQGDFNGTCPECGSHEIDELRRVTG